MGMLSSQEQNAPAMPPQQGQQGRTPQQKDPNLKKGTQEQFNIVVSKMLDYVYSDEGKQAIFDILKSDPENGMARVIGRQMTTTAQAAVQNRKILPPKVLFQSGMELSKAISELAQKYGLLDEQSEKQKTETAFFNGVAQFAKEAAQESMSEEEKQTYVGLLDILQKTQGGQPAQPEPPQSNQSEASEMQPKQEVQQ